MPLYLGGAANADATPPRTRTAGTLGASETIAVGALAMAVNGSAYTARSSTALAGLLATLSSQVPGADANGAVILCSHGRSKITVQFLGGQSKTLGLDAVVYGGGGLEVRIQLATDGSSVVTSTSAAVAAFMNNHTLLRSFGLRAAPSGNGTGLAAASSAIAIAVVQLLGFARSTYVNGAGIAASLEMTFDLGAQVLTGSLVERANVPALVRVVNGTTVSSVFAGELDLHVRAVDVPAENRVLIVVD